MMLTACAGNIQRAAPAEIDVVPLAELSPPVVRAGRPVLLRYRWTTGASYRPAPRAYRVFAHLVGDDGAVLVRDDHEPQPPTSHWGAGAEYGYARVVFTRHAFPGRLRLYVGLFDPVTGARARLHAPSDRQLAYGVGQVVVERAGVPRTRFFSGWGPPQGDPGDPFDVRRCMARAARLALPDPGREALLFLRGRRLCGERACAPHVRVEIGDTTATLTLPGDAKGPFVAALPVPAGDQVVPDFVHAGLEVLGAPADAGRTLCLDDAVLVPRDEVPADLRAATLVRTPPPRRRRRAGPP